MKSLWLRKALKSRLQIAPVVHWMITYCETAQRIDMNDIFINTWTWPKGFPYCQMLHTPGVPATCGVMHDLQIGATLKVLAFLHGTKEHIPTCETCRAASIAWGMDDMNAKGIVP